MTDQSATSSQDSTQHKGVAIVTGGLSGLGLATTEALAEAGYTVIAMTPWLRESEIAPKTYQGRFPRVLTFYGDVTDENAVDRLMSEASAICPVKILVNCAGVAHFGSLADAPFGQAVSNVMTNLVGTLNTCRAYAALLNGSGFKAVRKSSLPQGVIVNVASSAATDGGPGQVSYAASKAGVLGMTLPLAREYQGIGLRVMCISPGPFDTPMLRKKIDIGVMGSRIPLLKRVGKPDEFASLVMSIVGNDMLNGENIRLDSAFRG